MEPLRIRDYLNPLFIANVASQIGLLRTLAWVAGSVVGCIQAAIRRQWNREPTEHEALGLFLIALPVGLALMLIGYGNGLGYSPW